MQVILRVTVPAKNTYKGNSLNLYPHAVHKSTIIH